MTLEEGNCYDQFVYTYCLSVNVSAGTDVGRGSLITCPESLCYRASEGKRSQQPTVPYPPNLNQNLYIIHIINGLYSFLFIALQCHINDH